MAERKEDWARGMFLLERDFATSMAEARAIGNCETADAILRLEFEQLQGNGNE